ncbi:transmembrane protein 165 [Chrysoperla carnea]|uniref:transmembrane protein 165 n=1 Tax=Chrysoperla carnea TaxID=189513 RepID=UPI001D08832B|nr:transmembrane protein 165 [Chrysoperla carnea]
MSFKMDSSIFRISLQYILISCIMLHGAAEIFPMEIETKKPVSPADDTKGFTQDLGFIHAFFASLSVIIVSELGDKTFFIAAIMAMRHPRLTVFIGAISALALMTVLSALFGWIATVVPRAYTYYISTALFAIFGLKMLKEGYSMSPTDAQEELEEVQSDLRKKEEEYEKEASTSLLQDPESGVIRKVPKANNVCWFLSRIFLQSFTMTFLAEWGDRSQLTTIILAAREDVTGVIIGGILGHSLCTGLAVLGGRMIAQKISVRTVTLIGGVVFLIFAFSAFFITPET